jgi:hypothetical protein
MLVGVAGLLACSDPPPSGRDSGREQRDDTAVVVDDSVSPSNDTAALDRDEDGWPDAVDCDDDLAAVNPGAAEVCVNDLDDDCDSVIDRRDVALEGNVRERFYDPDFGARTGFGKSLVVERRDHGGVLWMSPQALVDDPTVRGATLDTWPVAAVGGFAGDPGRTRYLVAAGSDYDGDGNGDLAFGALGDGFDEAYLFDGPVVGGALVDDALADVRATADGGGPFVAAVYAVGDVTADGRDDLLFAGQSRAWVVAGPVVGSFDLDSMTDAGLEALTAATADDLDGDGVRDLVALSSVGSPNARVFLGPVVEPLDALAADAEWREERYPGFGTTVATGDLDGDGLADVAASDWGAATEKSPGVVYVIAGASSQSGTVHDLALATVSGAVGDRMSEFALAADDFDHDGVSDLVTGSVQALATSDGGGYVAIVLGPIAGAETIEGAANLILRGQPDESVGENVATGDVEIEVAITSKFPSTKWDIYTVDLVTPALVAPTE